MTEKTKVTLQRLLMAQRKERETIKEFISGASSALWGDISQDGRSMVDGKPLKERKALISKNTTSIQDRMKSIIDKRFLVNKLNNETKISIKDFFSGEDTEHTIAETILIRDTFRDIVKYLKNSCTSTVRSIDSEFTRVYNEWDRKRIELVSGENTTNGDVVELLLKKHDSHKPVVFKNEAFIESVEIYSEYLNQEIDIVLSEANIFAVAEV